VYTISHNKPFTACISYTECSASMLVYSLPWSYI